MGYIADKFRRKIIRGARRKGIGMLARVTLLGLGLLVPLATPAASPPTDTFPPAASRGPTELTQTDANAWLDGFVPYAIARGDIAGAVIVIVKDGEVLTQRGYGYADIAARTKVDPETTLFRVGSTSKLFTWTAVMQLVEQGKLDLDSDINRYLDFEIPPFQGKPITLRNIMTHTPGFEEAFKGGITYSGAVDPLGVVVKRLLPRRVYAPGTTPAYSNYATAVAGYIVERVSGMPFNTYIERKIFEPLGMDHSSFRQPLPIALAPFVAKGYPRASVAPQPFELISVPPAGSLSMTAADGARFMIAHLNHGAGLLQPGTADTMHTPAYGAIPRLNRMALGFYEQRINDLESIGHGGDLTNFHGDLWLFPQKHVGLMIEMNSAGETSATNFIRQSLFEQFADRYFPPASGTPPVELPTAKEHARMLAGHYSSSRGEFTTFADIGNFLNQTVIGLDDEGRPVVPQILGGPPRTWLEVEPFLWQDGNGHGRLGAIVANGKVVRWSINEIAPFMVFDRAPWYRDTSWLGPLAFVAFAIVVIAAFYWPISGVVRRRYRAALTLPTKDRKIYRAALLLCWLVIVASIGWALVLTVVLDSDSPADWPIYLSRICGDIAFVGLPLLGAWNLALTWRRNAPVLAKASSALLMAAGLIILWIALSFHLVGFSTQY